MKRTLLALASITSLGLGTLAADDQKSEPDNTATNERDRSGQTLTSGDQSDSPADLKTTQAVRQAVMKDDGLSMTAKNIKIITVDGQVTLRGPVNTEQEKTQIGQLAKSVAGGAKVDNQLEVKSK